MKERMLKNKIHENNILICINQADNSINDLLRSRDLSRDAFIVMLTDTIQKAINIVKFFLSSQPYNNCTYPEQTEALLKIIKNNTTKSKRFTLSTHSKLIQISNNIEELIKEVNGDWALKNYPHYKAVISNLKSCKQLIEASIIQLSQPLPKAQYQSRPKMLSHLIKVK